MPFQQNYFANPSLHPIAALWAAPGELFVKVRHEVAQLSVLKEVVGVPGMFLPDPTQACYRRADDGVRSPADNVPKRVQMATGEPLGESSPVKGQGRMIR